MTENNEVYRRRKRFWIIVLAAAFVVTAVSSVVQAGQIRPLRYYSDGNGTALTYFTTSNAGLNVSLWGINTDDPSCEFQIGSAICINGSVNTTQGVFVNGTALGSGSGADGNNYTTSISFNGAVLSNARNGASTLTATIPDNSITIDCSNITGGTDGDYCTDTAGAGGGTVTSITQGFGISATPNPIVAAGTIAWDNNSLTTICDTPNEYSSWNGSMFLCENDASGAGDGNNYLNGTSFYKSGNTYTISQSVAGLANVTGTFDVIDNDTDTDTNNYTNGTSVDGTTTKTLQIARVGMGNLTASWTDVDTDTNYVNNVTLSYVYGTTTKTLQINMSNGINTNASWTDIDTDTDTNYVNNVSSISFTNGQTKTATVTMSNGINANGTFTIGNQSILLDGANITTGTINQQRLPYTNGSSINITGTGAIKVNATGYIGYNTTCSFIVYNTTGGSVLALCN